MADSGSLISSKNSDKSRISNSINRTTSETLRLTESDKIVIQPTTLSASTPRKKTSFQITSVTVGSRASNDGGDDSADDLDESHTEDISEVIDNSRVTDLENETPSYSEDTFSKDDVFFNASSSLVSAPVIPTSSQYGLAILATPENTDPNVVNQSVVSENNSNTDVRVEVTESVINLGVVNTKHDSEMRDMHPPAPRTERFKVVKIESTEPFKRGRWVCMDYLDHNIAQNPNQNSNVKSEGVESISQSTSITSTETSTATVVETGTTGTNTVNLEDQQLSLTDQLSSTASISQQVIDPQIINTQGQIHPQGQQVHSQQPVQQNQQQAPQQVQSTQQISQPPPQQLNQQQLSQPSPPSQSQQIPQQSTQNQQQQQLTMNTPSSVPASYASISPGQSLQNNIQMAPANVNNQTQQQVPQQAQSLSQTHIQQLISNANQHQSLQPQQIQQVLASANIMPLQQQQPMQNQQPLSNQQSIPNQQAPMQNQQQPMPNQPQSMTGQQPSIQNQQQPLQGQSQMQGQQQMQNQQQPIQNQQQPMQNQQQSMQNQQPMQNQQQQQPMNNQQQAMSTQQQPMQNQQQPMIQQTMQQMPTMQQTQQYQQQPQQQYQSIPQQPQQQTMMQQQIPQQNMQAQMQSVPQVHMQSVPSSMQQMPIQPPSSQSQTGLMPAGMQMQQQQGSQMHQVSYSPPMGQGTVTQTSSQPQVQNMMQGMHPQQMQGYQQSQLLANLQAANLMGVASQAMLPPQYYTNPGGAGIQGTQGIMSSQGGGGMMSSMPQGSSMPQVTMQASTANIPSLQSFPVTSLPQMIATLPQTTPVHTSVQGYSLPIPQSSHIPTPTAQPLPTGAPIPHSIPPSLLQHQAYASLGTAAQTYAHSVVNSVPSSGSLADHPHSIGELHHDPLLAPTAALLESLAEVTATGDDLPTGDDAESASGTSAVAIDNKIEQAMDLVKSHLMFAVREEVEVLKEKINELMERISQLESENNILRAAASPDTIAQLPPPILQQTSNPP